MYDRPNKFLERIKFPKESGFDTYKGPFFSLIVWIHNVGSGVENCIQSLVQQSFKNIEIICVNDASTDTSLEIVRKYATNDLRIKIINTDTPLGKLATRMKGVELAVGQYILFIDSHDFLDVNACQSIFEALRKYDIDILQFKCGVEGQESEEAERKPWADQELTEKKLDNNQLLETLFESRSVSTSLLGKAIRTNIAKQANESIRVKEPYSGEDVYHSFFIAYYAKSFQYINTQPLCWVGKQSDSETKYALPLKTFAWYWGGNAFCSDIRDFLKNKGDLTKYHHIYEAISRKLLENCCEILKYQISIKNLRAAACYLYDFWKDNPVFESVIKQFFRLSSEQFYRRWVDQRQFVSLSGKYQHEAPLVSVIVPIYNCAQYIKDCLDSVVCQNEISVEVICVDDGSTDNSLEIVKEYQKTHDCISIISKVNEGLSIARNVGLKYARGTYVQFLDSDDMLLPGALDRLYQVSKKENLDVLFFNAKTIYDDETLRQSFPQYENYYVTKTDLSLPRRGLDLLVCMQQFGEYRTLVWRQFFKRTFLLENRLLFEENILHEDNLFTFQCLCRANLAARINECFYCRRIRRDSIMTTPTRFENVYGYLRCYLGMEKETLSLGRVSGEQENILKFITGSVARAVVLNYEKLDLNEQKRIASLTPDEEHSFNQLSSRFHNRNQNKKEQVTGVVSVKNKELHHTKPKNLLRAAITSYRTNGFVFTVYKAFNYIRHKIFLE